MHFSAFRTSLNNNASFEIVVFCVLAVKSCSFLFVWFCFLFFTDYGIIEWMLQSKWNRTKIYVFWSRCRCFWFFNMQQSCNKVQWNKKSLTGRVTLINAQIVAMQNSNIFQFKNLINLESSNKKMKIDLCGFLCALRQPEIKKSGQFSNMFNVCWADFFGTTSRFLGR